MTAGQISRSAHYQQRDEGYQLWFPYDLHRVIAIKRIAEPVFAKSILRGEGNTDAGEDVEISNYFGSTAVYQVQPKLIPSEQAKPAEFSIASLFGISTAEANPFIFISLATMFLQQMAVSGGAVRVKIRGNLRMMILAMTFHPVHLIHTLQIPLQLYQH